MIIPDINLLVYAYDESSPFHQAARTWFSRLLDGRTEVGFPLVCLLGFIRLVSNPKIFKHPISAQAACEIAKSWLAAPAAALLEPGGRHFEVLHRLLGEAHAVSALTTDAHLAALAVEHHAVIHSNDSDFSRFPEVHRVNPLENDLKVK